MKACPFCAEEIQDAAIKCRFCGEFLEPQKCRHCGESAEVPVKAVKQNAIPRMDPLPCAFCGSLSACQITSSSPIGTATCAFCSSVTNYKISTVRTKSSVLLPKGTDYWIRKITFRLRDLEGEEELFVFKMRWGDVEAKSGDRVAFLFWQGTLTIVVNLTVGVVKTLCLAIDVLISQLQWRVGRWKYLRATEGAEKYPETKAKLARLEHLADLEHGKEVIAQGNVHQFGPQPSITGMRIHANKITRNPGHRQSLSMMSDAEYQSWLEKTDGEVYFGDGWKPLTPTSPQIINWGGMEPT